MEVLRPLVILVLALSISGCAQIASPSGGKKDQKPPSFVKAIPEKGATGVRPGTVRIFFDEFIKLQNKRQNLLFSPPIEGYDLVRRKQSVEIQLPKDSLKDSVTHTIQFGSSIKDITEGNTLKGFEYVFSTGNNLDSLALKGSLKDAYTLDSITDGSILLYRAANDHTIRSNRPYYYTEVSNNGGFSFKYLRPGKYHVFALKDLNNNLKFDPGEKIGFKERPVTVKKDTTISPLRLFEQPTDSAGIVKVTNPFKGLVKLSFNQKVDTFEVINQTIDSIYWNLKEDGKKGQIFFYPSKQDSISFLVRLNQKRLDTAIVIRSLTGKNGLERDTNLTVSLSKKELPVDSPIVFRASHPLQNVVDSFIGYMKDSAVIYDGIKGEITGKNSRKVSVRGSFGADSSYKLLIDSGAFRDIYGNRSRTLDETVKFKKKEEYGLMELQVDVSKGLPAGGNIILELRDKEGDLIRRKCQEKGTNKFLFDKLTPGSYRVKGIIDANGNGFWDEGNLSTKKLPEKVFYFEKIIKVKPNWEMRDLKFKLGP